IPGMGETTARHFRDKLAMRVQARDEGMRVPPFTAVFNYDDLRAYMAAVPAPWVLKPRFEAGAVGIRKLHDSEQVWRALDELGDQQSFYLLEQFVPGDVFHVDSLIWDGELVFSIASQYGLPPLAVSHGGGIFTTRTLPWEGAAAQTLRGLTAELMQKLRLPRGVSHTEFIRGHADGEFYFLETAARVGGANIDRMVHAATGIELWAEAARIELASLRRTPYELPANRRGYAGLLTCLARQEHPDLSAYNDPEVVWRVPKAYHAGLIVAADEHDRVAQLQTAYAERFAHDFLTTAPPKSDVRTTI
ncbi:MAG: ATPase, partial [Caldilineaceae bacterium]|nr:ATPase [Caldilineaceae bacterium]